MGNKFKIGLIAAAAIAVVLAAVLIFKKGGNPGPEFGGYADLDEEYRALISQTVALSADYAEGEETSIDKIHKSWEEKKISPEQYALYSLAAIYGREDLPAEYRGAPDTSKDHAFLYGLIYSKWESFSSEAKEKILPFLLMPDDPASYFYPEPETPPVSRLIKAARAEELVLDIR